MTYRSRRPASRSFAFQFSDVKPGCILAETNVMEAISLRVESVRFDKANTKWVALGTNVATGKRAQLSYWVQDDVRNYPIANLIVKES
jgi:hypothetical protein